MKTKPTWYVALVFATLLMGVKEAVGQALAERPLIPAGTFEMGDSFNEGPPYERPAHSVYVSEFTIDPYPVTKELWDEVYEWAIAHGYSFSTMGTSDGVNHPVRLLSWYDMVKWCNARSEMERKIPAYYINSEHVGVYRTGRIDIQSVWVKWNAGYRLPTSAEWEKAARGGLSGRRFPWGNTISHSQANYQSDAAYSYDISPTRGYHPDYDTPKGPSTSPVETFPPNGYGLYDTIGNVWEWCFDWWSENYYSSSPGIDPQGPSLGSERVLRGGSKADRAYGCRTAVAGRLAPIYLGANIGLRTVLPGGLFRFTEFMEEVLLTQPTYSCSIEKQPGKDSLVVITHGWIPKEDTDPSPPDPKWVDEMRDAIRNDIARQGKDNWQVESFKWKEKAWMKLSGVVNDSILENAEKEGVNLGNCLKNQGWKRIHFLSHSAGAPVEENACAVIKKKDPTIIVHETFLDPYVGLTYQGRKKYGKSADWAESYFANKEITDTVFDRTSGQLKYAYSADVTWLAKKKTIYVYSSGGPIPCQQTVSSHEWPHEFYLDTVLNPTKPEFEGLGFSLSEEGGGDLNFAIQNYQVTDDSSPRTLGEADPDCYRTRGGLPIYQNTRVDFKTVETAPSPAGIFNNGDSLILTKSSQAPLRSLAKTGEVEAVWIGALLPVTNAVNFVSFDAEFISAEAAEGIMSVYWGTNSIGTIDERVVLPGLQSYTYSLSETITNGMHTLGFRLDAFTLASSSIVITNVTLGFVGISEPFRLAVTGKDTNGLPIFSLYGPSGFDYFVEVSTNLIDWESIVILVNTNGTVQFTDPVPNTNRRFYRAIGR